MSQKPIVGVKGAKYGLVLPREARQAAAQPKPRVGLSVFAAADDSDEEEQVHTQLKRQADKKASDRKVAAAHAAALDQDPTAYAYDEVYDDIKTARTQTKLQDKVQRQSKYIESLLENKKEHDKLQELWYERAVAKEQAKEAHLYGDKEKYITSAYRKKLEEDQKWLAQKKMKEAQEERDAVEKRGHMMHFYQNLLKDNAAFGTAKIEQGSPTSEQPTTAATSQHAEGTSDQSPDDKPADLHKDITERARHQVKDVLDRMDSYERLRLMAERGGDGHLDQAAATTSTAADAAHNGTIGASANRASGDEGSGADTAGHAMKGSSTARSDTAERSTDAGSDAVAALDKREAARLRFLARKRKQPES